MDAAQVMAQIPAIPASPCYTDTMSIRLYQQQLSRFHNTVSKELKWRKEKERKNREGLETAMKANMAKQYGLDQGDVQRMENMKNMSKEQREKLRKEMADKMMLQSKTGMTSVEDVTGIKDAKSKEGKTAYAKSLAKPMEAEKVGDSVNNAKETARIKKLKNLVEEQQYLIKMLNAVETKYEKQYWELENDPFKLDKEREIKEKDSLLVDYDMKGGAPPNPYREHIRLLKIIMCDALTPKFVKITNEYIAAISSKLTQYARLEVLTDEIFKLQNNVNESPMVPGLLQLEKIAQCTGGLGGVFKYRPPEYVEQNTIEE
jgi:hypothetical protein